MTNNKIKLHLIPEYGLDFRPHGSAFIRLLRPFYHPAFKNFISVSDSVTIESIAEGTQIVIVDRFWRPDINIEYADSLISKIRGVNAKFVYSYDDDFFALKEFRDSSLSQIQLEVFSLFIKNADSLLVTTSYLKERYSKWNKNIFVLPNFLDEQLICGKNLQINSENLVRIGYMGTFEHKYDFEFLIPILSKLHQDMGNKVRFELLGVINSKDLGHMKINFPIYEIPIDNDYYEYPLFMTWFTSKINWDIGISPLANNKFNKSKSYIKYLDYASIKAAGIYSSTQEYNQIIKNGKNGLLAENMQDWEVSLRKLIRDSKLRNSIITYAYNDLLSNHTIKQNTEKIIKTIQALL
jgi:glycosyltransferase involved in cell wall biosynthesis